LVNISQKGRSLSYLDSRSEAEFAEMEISNPLNSPIQLDKSTFQN
jgi:hypothetical protein